MVKKTRRKRSAAKRVKTAKHRNSKRSKRGRGRRNGRTTKRGGMPLASRVALRNGPPAFFHNVISGRNPDPREGALAINGIRYFGLPSDMPPPSTKEQAYKEYKEKTKNPVELLSTADSVFSAAHKAKYNEQLHAQIEENQTPARTQTRNLFYTPGKQGNSYKDATGSIIPQPTFSTPFGPSSELSSPPPPNLLFVEGKTKPITESPSFRRGFAPTIKNPNPDDPAQRLDFLLGDDESNKYQTPNSSPYNASKKSTQKGFDKKNHNKKLGDTISSPTRPPFRI